MARVAVPSGGHGGVMYIDEKDLTKSDKKAIKLCTPKNGNKSIKKQ